jgi:hypothetical protein
MRKKYYGSVRAQGAGTVYENWYETRGKAVGDLKEKARETILNSFDEDINVGFMVSLGNNVVAEGRIPKQRLPRRYAGPVCSVYGLLPVSGTRIC